MAALAAATAISNIILKSQSRQIIGKAFQSLPTVNQGDNVAKVMLCDV